MNRLKENQKTELAKGILAGLLVPFVSYAVLLLLNEKISALIFKEVMKDELILDNKTVAILAICFNLLPFHLLDKKKQTRAMRGVLISTFLLAMLWIFLFGKEAITLSWKYILSLEKRLAIYTEVT